MRKHAIGRDKQTKTEAAQHRPAAERDKQTRRRSAAAIALRRKEDDPDARIRDGPQYRRRRGKSDPQAQRGFVLCDRLHHMVFERYMKNNCTPFAALGIVVLGAQRREQAWQKEIAEAMEVSPAAVTGTVKKLEKSGYVTKTVVDRDNRQNQIAHSPRKAQNF